MQAYKSRTYTQKRTCRRLINLFIFILISSSAYAQTVSKDDAALELFMQKQKLVSRSFSTYFNSHITALYGAGESTFIQKIDSLRSAFIIPLDSLKMANPNIRASFFEEQYTELNYTFDKFILDYVPVHKRITGQTVTLSKATQARLQKIDINNPEDIKYSAFREYLNSVLQQNIDIELLNRKKAYQKSNNKHLDAGMVVVMQLFKNPVVQNQMLYDLLAYHIDNYGVKDISRQMALFRQKNNNNKLLAQIDSVYNEGIADRKEHLIEVYKKVDGYTLDAHIFMPKDDKKMHSAIVFFHGGGWNEGKPDWFFYTCQQYAAKGWVAIAIEYRLRGRHGTLPPEAIADGKSAIRYLRKYAQRLGIDPNHIVASGNSAGANLALALTVIDTLDDKKEDLNISSVPNSAMLNSVATDFTQGDFWQQYYADKKFLERISPLHQVRKNLPPILLISGNKDNNVPIQPTIAFAEKMKAIGNDCELHVLDGAGHFLWYDKRFGNQVEEYRSGFLKRLGY
jgi:acetyl esterase/lipase